MPIQPIQSLQKFQTKQKGKRFKKTSFNPSQTYSTHTHEHTYAMKLKHETQHEKNEVKYSYLQNWVMENEKN